MVVPSARTGTGRPAKPAGDWRLRAVSALVLAPVVLALTWLGGAAFALLVAAAAAILVGEWSGVTRSRYMDAAVVIGAGSAALAVLAMAGGYPLAAVGLLAVGAATGQAVAWRSDPARLLAAGVVYAGVPGIALVVLRHDPAMGLWAIAWLLAVVWASDVGAYLCGRTFGGPKLAPRISPNKTWSGFVGGVVAGTAAGILVALWAAPDSMRPLIAAGAAVAAVSQGGDLGESALKRRFGVKDASGLIPGHGGLMDRVDGLTAAAVVTALIGSVRGGLDAAGSGLLQW